MDTATRDRTVSIQVTVLNGKNMRGTKGESLLSFVQVEFSGSVLGNSQKLDGSTERALEYNYTCSFDCFDGANTLDDLAHKPVILTVIEILPKETKKQKEEKTSVLGQAVVDLLPLLQGQQSFTSTVPLYPVPGAPGDMASQEGSSKPTLDVSISVSEMLLSDVQLCSSNLLRVVVEAAYSVPEVWSADAEVPLNYIAAFQVPVSAENEQVLLFSNGVLKMGEEQEPCPRPKKWPFGHFLAACAQFIPGAFIEEEPIESGKLDGAEHQEVCADAESRRKRVSWDTERRCFMEAGAVACLTQRIVDCRLWPIEVMRSPQAGTTKGIKPDKENLVEEENQIQFHGVAYVDMSALLYPGVRRIYGAYLVHPFYESDLLAKCKVSPSKIFDIPKKAKDTKEVLRKSGTQGKPLLAKRSSEVDMQVNIEGQMYAEAKTYIVVEISLEKPLVPKRPPEELAKRVLELIPSRPLPAYKPTGAKRAVKEYQAQIMNVADQVRKQYQHLFGSAVIPGPLDPVTKEQRKAKLIGELNYSGKYFAFKEQMKHSMVQIVKEKMLCTKSFSSLEQLQAFLSQLYIFLVDEMHVALNKTLSVDPQDDQSWSPLSCAQLKHFAQEALLIQDYQLADTFYKECIAQNQSNPGHWFDYGAFHMLTGDFLKAEECFHQAVSIDRAHLPSLLMCGILAEMAHCMDDTETFLEGATCVDPTSTVAWTLLGLFYVGQERTIQAEMAFLEANRQHRAATMGPLQTEGEPQTQSQGEQVLSDGGDATKNRTGEEWDVKILAIGQPSSQDSETSVETRIVHNDQPTTSFQSPVQSSTSIYMEAVQFLLENNVFSMAQRALAQELLCPEGGKSSHYYLALARLQLMREEFSSAQASLQEALKFSFENPDVWAWCGHLHYLTKNYNKAQECYERTLDLVKDASDTHAIYLRLGDIYLQEKLCEKAKITYLHACKTSPSCLSWLGLGIACYWLGDYSEAEDALTEANTLNNRNAEVWGYLSLVCLQTRRQLEAEQSYKYAIKLNLQKASLLEEIEKLQAEVGFGNPSF